MACSADTQLRARCRLRRALHGRGPSVTLMHTSARGTLVVTTPAPIAVHRTQVQGHNDVQDAAAQAVCAQNGEPDCQPFWPRTFEAITTPA